MSSQNIEKINSKLQELAVSDPMFAGVVPILYVLASNSTRYKEIIFDPSLSKSDILAKLDKWTDQKRIVRVFETCNDCFVQMHATHQERFQESRDLIEGLKGKAVAIETLDDEAYEGITTAAKDHVEDMIEGLIGLNVDVLQSHPVHSESKVTEVKSKKALDVAPNLTEMFTWKGFLAETGRIVQKILDVITRSVREETELANESAKYDQIITTAKAKQRVKHEIEQRAIQTEEVKRG